MNVKQIFQSAAIVCSAFLGSTAFAQPIITDNAQLQQNPNSGDAVTTGWKPSLVRDGVIDRVPHVNRILPWQPIRENDVLWKKRVWREIDTREKQNMAFRYPGDENTGGGFFIEILLDAVKRGKLKAYNAFGEDRFQTALTKDQVMEMMVGSKDSTEVIDPITGTVTISVTNRDFNPELITKYRVKEDVIFDRNLGRRVVRILGIAPVQDVYDPNTNVFRGTRPMFWLYYPEMRETLAQYEVYNPESDLARMNWDEYFEGRFFSSRITKVSNTFGNDISESGLNGMEALYQSQRLEEELFNKEHDLWVY